jgi:hypothetical protein
MRTSENIRNVRFPKWKVLSFMLFPLLLPFLYRDVCMILAHWAFILFARLSLLQLEALSLLSMMHVR